MYVEMDQQCKQIRNLCFTNEFVRFMLRNRFHFEDCTHTERERQRISVNIRKQSKHQVYIYVPIHGNYNLVFKKNQDRIYFQLRIILHNVPHTAFQAD